MMKRLFFEISDFYECFCEITMSYWKNDDETVLPAGLADK